MAHMNYLRSISNFVNLWLFSHVMCHIFINLTERSIVRAIFGVQLEDIKIILMLPNFKY